MLLNSLTSYGPSLAELTEKVAADLKPFVDTPVPNYVVRSSRNNYRGHCRFETIATAGHSDDGFTFGYAIWEKGRACEPFASFPHALPIIQDVMDALRGVFSHSTTSTDWSWIPPSQPFGGIPICCTARRCASSMRGIAPVHLRLDRRDLAVPRSLPQSIITAISPWLRAVDIRAAAAPPPPCAPCFGGGPTVHVSLTLGPPTAAGSEASPPLRPPVDCQAELPCLSCMRCAARCLRASLAAVVRVFPGHVGVTVNAKGARIDEGPTAIVEVSAFAHGIAATAASVIDQCTSIMPARPARLSNPTTHPAHDVLQRARHALRPSRGASCPRPVPPIGYNGHALAPPTLSHGVATADTACARAHAAALRAPRSSSHPPRTAADRLAAAMERCPLAHAGERVCCAPYVQPVGSFMNPNPAVAAVAEPLIAAAALGLGGAHRGMSRVGGSAGLHVGASARNSPAAACEAAIGPSNGLILDVCAGGGAHGVAVARVCAAVAAAISDASDAAGANDDARRAVPPAVVLLEVDPLLAAAAAVNAAVSGVSADVAVVRAPMHMLARRMGSLFAVEAEDCGAASASTTHQIEEGAADRPAGSCPFVSGTATSPHRAGVSSAIANLRLQTVSCDMAALSAAQHASIHALAAHSLSADRVAPPAPSSRDCSRAAYLNSLYSCAVPSRVDRFAFEISKSQTHDLSAPPPDSREVAPGSALAAQKRARRAATDGVVAATTPSKDPNEPTASPSLSSLGTAPSATSVQPPIICTIVDPPRGGLDARTAATVEALPTVVYVACDPRTFAANATGNIMPAAASYGGPTAAAAGRALRRWTHQVVSVGVLDQFPGTQHVETVVALRKRAPPVE